MKIARHGSAGIATEPRQSPASAGRLNSRHMNNMQIIPETQDALNLSAALAHQTAGPIPLRLPAPHLLYKDAQSPAPRSANPPATSPLAPLRPDCPADCSADCKSWFADSRRHVLPPSLHPRVRTPEWHTPAPAGLEIAPSARAI